MRRPSTRLTPNRVTVRRVGFGRDAAAGRTVAESPDPLPYAVSVHPAAAADVPEHHREQGVTYLTVKFYDDPGLRVRDEVIDGQGRVLVVRGVRGSSGGVGRSWPVDCEYRPSPGK